MTARTRLQELIRSFDAENLAAFFRATSDRFKPVAEDFSHYVDDDHHPLSDLQQIGEIEFNDVQRLLVMAARSERDLTSRSGKKKQYDLGKKILRDRLYDAGIFVFYDDNGNFRFSLILAQYFGKKRRFSNFRRHTYFVSPDLPNKTFLNQVGRADFSNIEDIQAAFSIEAVSNDFYNEFKPKFDRVTNAVQGTNDIALKQDFALLFVIRTIFLGFVQKKGWLGDNHLFLQDYWEEYRRQFIGRNEFYSRWMVPLFF